MNGAVGTVLTYSRSRSCHFVSGLRMSIKTKIDTLKKQNLFVRPGFGAEVRQGSGPGMRCPFGRPRPARAQALPSIDSAGVHKEIVLPPPENRETLERIHTAPAEMIVRAAAPISHSPTSASSGAIVDLDPFSVTYNDSGTNGAGAIREAVNALPVGVAQHGEDFQDLSQPRFARFYTAVKILGLASVRIKPFCNF